MSRIRLAGCIRAKITKAVHKNTQTAMGSERVKKERKKTEQLQDPFTCTRKTTAEKQLKKNAPIFRCAELPRRSHRAARCLCVCVNGLAVTEQKMSTRALQQKGNRKILHRYSNSSTSAHSPYLPSPHYCPNPLGGGGKSERGIHQRQVQGQLSTLPSTTIRHPHVLGWMGRSGKKIEATDAHHPLEARGKVCYERERGRERKRDGETEGSLGKVSRMWEIGLHR